MVRTYVGWIMMLGGAILTALGSAIGILNNWGSDPVAVLGQGLSIQLAAKYGSFFSIGNTLVLVNLIAFIGLLFIERKRLFRIGTFIAFFLTNVLIDIWLRYLTPWLTANHSVLVKIILMISGIFTLSTGIALYVCSNMGASPLDLLSVEIAKKAKLRYTLIRIICDLLFVIIGGLLHADIGVATFLCMGLIGPLSGFIIGSLQKWVLYPNPKISKRNTYKI